MSLLVAAGFQFTFAWLADVLVVALLYATLAVSLNLVTGFAGMFSLGHHGFYAVGAYAAGATVAWATSAWGTPTPGSAAAIGLFVASAFAAVAAASAAGFAVGLPCLRLRGDYLAIATLGFGEIVRIVIQNTRALEGSLGMYVPRLVMNPTGRIDTFRLVFLGIAAALLAFTVVVVRNLVRSAHGRAIVSIREDEVATEILGVRTTGYKMRAFVLGSAFAGLAGWLFTHYNAFIAPPSFDLMTGIRILLIVVLGGMGSITGSILAAFVLVGAERLLLTGLFGETLKSWVQVEYALLLILLMLLRPRGLLGDRELPDLLRGRSRARARLDA
jgi:branched-chain amino acid transport system permease protein